jgi:hypothetical protein
MSEKKAPFECLDCPETFTTFTDAAQHTIDELHRTADVNL